MQFMKWDEFFKLKEVDGGFNPSFIKTESVKKKNSVEKKKKGKEEDPEEDNKNRVGELMDFSNTEKEYEKMLDFLRGKGNVKNAEPMGVSENNITTPENNNKPKGWLIIDESTYSFWIDGGWSKDINLIQDAVFNNEEAAQEVAKAVSGIVVMAEEIIG